MKKISGTIRRIEADLFADPWWSLYAGAGIGAGVKVEVWDFTLIDYETDPPPILYEILIASAGSSFNQAPEEPSDPIPADNITEVSITSPLSWTCSDPDSDPLTFDIYFGTESPPPLVQSATGDFSYDPGNLINSTVYYWRVVAKDDHDHTVAGPVWTFATEASGGGTGDPCPGLSSITYQGKVYHTALIATQCWLKENLDAGTMINSSQAQGDNAIMEKYCYQNQAINCNLKGGLYQWNEMMNYSTTAGAKGICPDGWHVPTDAEVKTMEIALGMSPADADLTGWRGTDQGTQLKPGGPTGFDALMGGIYNLGFFSDLGVNGYFATSTESTSTNSWIRLMNVDNPKVSRYETLKQNAVSVRCLKD
ncbi:MAG: fibrobacter succinogenes major paralogous domain-containing protein [Bacteroidales bacterium]|nr:fibrobacter succinogenes major paralogous domain-containing protein [Bacteroidales bacterium]